MAHRSTSSSEFGVDAARDEALDRTTRLAIGAGLDALRDAGIPLVMRYKTTTLGTQLPDRWGLPEAMRDETGVIFASAFPGYDRFAEDIESYGPTAPAASSCWPLEGVRARMTGVEPAAPRSTAASPSCAHLLRDASPTSSTAASSSACLAMGHSQFAELIGARGPNTQVNAACASHHPGRRRWPRTGSAPAAAAAWSWSPPTT